MTSAELKAKQNDPAPPPPLLLTYKFRLLPEKRQHRALERILDQQRQLYNAALAERVEAYRKSAAITIAQIVRDRADGIARIREANGTIRITPRRTLPANVLDDLVERERKLLAGEKNAARGITEVEQSRSLTQIRADDPEFAGVQRRIQRETLRRLDRAYKSFFRRVKEGAGASAGFPRFKGHEYFDGFGFDAFQQVQIDGNGLRFSGMVGKLRFWRDRPLPQIADPETGELSPRIKGLWFKRDGLIVARRVHGLPQARIRTLAKRWFCGFQVEVERKPQHDRGKPVGVDWGTSVLAALSTGEEIPNPRHGEQLAKDVARAQRNVSRKRKGSKRRLKARRHLQAINRRVANRRRDTLDKQSKRLVNHHHFVGVEDLNVKGMMDAERPGEDLPEHVKTRRNREALDAAPYRFRQMLAYKAERDGAILVAVDAKNTTQDCFWCGLPHYKELTDDVHTCTRPGPFFGKSAPRKVNAARVILKRALSLWDEGGGGPVPGGAKRGSAPVCLGNTEEGQSSPGRRGLRPLASMREHAPRPPPGRLRSAPS